MRVRVVSAAGRMPGCLEKRGVSARARARVAVECGCGRTAALVAPGMMGVRRRASPRGGGRGPERVCVGEVPRFRRFLPFVCLQTALIKVRITKTVLVTEGKGFC